MTTTFVSKSLKLLPVCSCKAEELVMIGDRYLTDVVYGNRNGLFTIRPAPLTLEGEPSAVLLVSRTGILNVFMAL